MVFIKYISLLLVLFTSIYLGIIKSKCFEERVKELQKFKNSLNMLKNKVEFTHEPIRTVFDEITKIIYDGKDNIFSLTNTENELYLSWNQSVEKESYLNKEDKEIIKTFGKQLGMLDIKGQITEIELTEQLISNQIIKAEEEKNKNVKLYKALGVVLGLGIVIIMI